MAEDSKVLQVENPNPETVGYQPAVQSANTLFHFEKKSEYLFSIIEKMAIVPRYCVEDIDYLDIGIEEIAYPMLCFCDINLHKIQEHMNFYGQYGIAFSKQWGISRGIQPIQYVNPNSILRHDFTEAFQASMDAPEESAAQNYLQSHMYYLKPIQGTMQRDGKSVLKNFTDECEWRFIPNVSKENLPQAITQAEIFSRSRLNETIAICENCWLKFNAEDIKYIILQTHDEFEKVVAMIAEKALSSKVKSWLMSKILVWPEVKGGFLMFSNFRDTFIKKPQYTSAPPQAVIDSISQELPEGFYYIHSHDGYCMIDAPKGLNIQSGTVLLSDEDKAILPDNYTIEDILKYSYNVQKEITLLPNEDGCFMVNGSYVRAVDFVKAPMRDIDFINAQLRIVPPKFPEPFDLEISGNEHTQKLHINRVPNRNLNVEKYESDGSTVIKVWFTIDPTLATPFTFNITVNMKRAKTVREAISAYYIYNAFADGKGYIGGNPLSIKDHTPFEKVPVEVIRLAEKLSQLEEYLDVQFDFSKGVTIADAKTADELYRSIIEKKPFKRFKTFDTLSGKGHFITASEQGEYINTAIAFEFSESKHISLLNANFTCRAINCIFNAVIASFSANGDEETGDFVIHLTTAPGEKMYESVQYFISEDQLDAFRENKEHITILRDATEISALE